MNGEATEEEWDFVCHEWDNFKKLTNVGGNGKEHLKTVLSDISEKVYQRLGAREYSALDEQGLLEEAAAIAVKKRNKLVHRLKLYDMKQEEDEAITSFETRVKPVARTGKFKVECSDCRKDVDYTDEVVKDMLVKGLYFEDIKAKVMTLDEKDCTLTKMLRLVEAERLGKRSVNDTKANGEMGRITSTYRKQKSGIEGGTSNGEGTPICKKCGHQASHERCPAIGRICHKCQKQDHFQSMCKGKKSTKNTGSDRGSHGHIGFVEEVKAGLNNDPPGGEGRGLMHL